MRSLLLVLVPIVSLMGCDRGDGNSKPEPGPTAKRYEEPKPAVEADAEAEAKPEDKPQAKPEMPPEARRNSPPKDMEILAEGAASPTMQDLPSTEGPWSRSNSPTIVAFYRGHW